MIVRSCALISALTLAITVPAQTLKVEPNQQNESERTLKVLLDTVGPKRRHVVTSVYLLICGGVHGTGFALKSGLLVTNSHVIKGCKAEEVVGHSASGKEIRFLKDVRDESRDLALLKPTEALNGGLSLGDDKAVVVGKGVETWGFPIIYTSGAPLLTVGYVSGFNTIGSSGAVKHVVVNGAFNPGNSGGPVFMTDDDTVIGTVVWRNRLTSNNVPVVINGLRHPKASLGGTYSKTLPDGSSVPVSNEEAVASVLDEFYQLVQVQIGEAISVSELKSFIMEKEAELK